VLRAIAAWRIARTLNRRATDPYGRWCGGRGLEPHQQDCHLPLQTPPLHQAQLRDLQGPRLHRGRSSPPPAQGPANRPLHQQTMEPIEPPWQAVKEWIPDDEPDLNCFKQAQAPIRVGVRLVRPNPRLAAQRNPPRRWPHPRPRRFLTPPGGPQKNNRCQNVLRMAGRMTTLSGNDFPPRNALPTTAVGFFA
jgi:hypothetical protein